MLMLDREIHTAKALIVDGNPTSRSVMAAQLRDLGVQNVRQVSRAQDARLVLEKEPHDIVLCEVSFEGAPMSGQDLLDELRREQLLPYSTVFVLVTGEATYAQVREAAESTVDGYLVKPYSATVLAERLQEARRRKRTLRDIYEPIRAGAFAQAAEVAERRYEAREPYGLFAAQMAAELWLRADQPARALKVFNAVLEDKPQPWARAGVARVKLATGELGAARRALEDFTAQDPGYADARDLLGRVLVEQGEFAAAQEAFRACISQTPGCLVRLQQAGALAFYLGHKDEAARLLDRAVVAGRKSRLFDVLSLLLLAFLKFDARDGRNLPALLDQLKALAGIDAESRPARIARIAEALAWLQARKVDEALAAARALAAEVLDPDHDLEAASLSLSLWARLPAEQVPADEREAFLRAAGMRLAVSKASTEVLVASAAGLDGAEETLRHCHAEVTRIAEDALNRSLSGQAQWAVEMLLERGEATRNAKLIEMAGAVARRHPDQVADTGEVLERVRGLLARYCPPLTHIAGVRRSARMPGGLVLRA